MFYFKNRVQLGLKLSIHKYFKLFFVVNAQLSKGRLYTDTKRRLKVRNKQHFQHLPDKYNSSLQRYLGKTTELLI